MKHFKLCWICLTGTGIGQWKVVEEFFETEEQARAVFDGHGPRPQAWWNLNLMKRKSENGLCSTLAYQDRDKAEAEAELGGAAGVAA